MSQTKQLVAITLKQVFSELRPSGVTLYIMTVRPFHNQRNPRLPPFHQTPFPTPYPHPNVSILGTQTTQVFSLCCESVSYNLRISVRVFCIVLSIFGFVVNVVNIVAILKYKLQKEPSIFCILNLTINNTLICILVLPNTAKNTYMEDVDSVTTPTCIIAGFVTFGLFGAEFFSMLLISLNRYLMFLHVGLYRKLYLNSRNLALLTIFSWAFPFTMLFMPLTNAWGSFTYKAKRFVCDPFHVMFYRIFIMLAIIICTLPVLLFCYGKILHKVLSNKKRIDVARATNVSQTAISTVSSTTKNNKDRPASGLPEKKNKERHLILSVTAIFVTYAVLYSPFIVLNLYDPEMTKVDAILHAGSTYLGWSHCVINTLVYTALNTKIKDAVRQLLKDSFAQPPVEEHSETEIPEKIKTSMHLALDSV